MLYKILQVILRVIIRPLFLFEIYGKENIPDEGGYIICANHTSMWDPFFLSVTFKRQIRFMGKKEIFNFPILGGLATTLGSFPVDRDGRDLNAIRQSISIIENGEVIGIFPEGTRTHSIDRSYMKDGVGYIALKANAKILPVEIVSRFIPFTKTKIFIKQPIDSKDYKHLKSKEAMNILTDKIFDNIYEMQIKELEK